MADFLQLTVLGDRNLLRNLEQMPDTVRAILLEKTRALTEDMADKVRQNIESRLSKTDKSKEYSGSPRHLKDAVRSEEHTSELQSLMRISYAVFCLKNKHNKCKSNIKKNKIKKKQQTQ